MDRQMLDLVRSILILAGAQLTILLAISGYVVWHVEGVKSAGRKAGEELRKVADDMKARVEKSRVGR